MLHISEKKFKDTCEVNSHWASVVDGLVTPNIGALSPVLSVTCVTGDSAFSYLQSYVTTIERREIMFTKPKSYEFGYSVKDSRSGNDYGRREKSDGHEVRGEYRVFLPDGRTQIVTYHADWKTGFHADVRYEGEATYPNNVQGGYNYNAPTDFSGSLTGFHGNDLSKQTVYDQNSYY
ncbi:Pro-resilin [Papilio machaon]|uniref:Pro-resilin n=1 Tax=Papilio machaon TaxID=76193 RepID=A0A0N1PGG7_PAPMA|nr:Pro-resilin [Papilio machaon]